MTSAAARYGFRVVGNVSEERRLVDAAAAFAAHCAADPKAKPDHECYLSASRFGDEYHAHHLKANTPRGYAGVGWSPWLWFDIDREDPAVALADARKLAGYVLFRYTGFDEDDPLYFYSGRKGFHVGVPLTHSPPPSVDFHRVCWNLAQHLAAEVAVAIDTSVYTLVQPFRAPNSRHAKTGLHKRGLTYAELMKLSMERIRELAAEPFGFEVPAVTANPPELAEDWREAEIAIAEQRTARHQGHTTPSGRLSRATLDFIREGAGVGDRHPGLFREAANLRESAAPPELIHALLTDAGLDCGLSPSDVRRQIDCGITHADQQVNGQGGAA